MRSQRDNILADDRHNSFSSPFDIVPSGLTILPATQSETMPVVSQQPPATINWNTDLPPEGYLSTTFWFVDQLECSGKTNLKPYYDSVGHPTIGIGFDLLDANSLDAVLDKFGIADNDPVRNDIETVLGTHYNTQKQLDNALNAIMAQWGPNHGGRTTFAFTDANEAIAVYNTIIQTYEDRVDANSPGVPESYERVALVSLSYNGGLGPKLAAAISAGDRAEAWFEIRYDTDPDGSLAKRRYIEAQEFGVYHDKHANGRADVTGQEALLAFRMANKHENKIATYDGTYSGVYGDANADITKISHNLTGFDIGNVGSIDQELAPALARLVLDYSDLSNVAHALQDAIGYTTEQGLDFAITTPDAAWVAADMKGGKGEVVAHTVDRTGHTTMNDLIFGSITSDTNDSSARDTLNGAAGDDFIVGSSGNDTIDGGAGHDTMSYLGSVAPVNVNLSTGTGSGGFADGDTLSNIENVFGSAGDDTLVSTATTGTDNILYGGAGNDTITGGDQDLLVGGAGNDHIFVTGTIITSASVIGGSGNDTIDATALSGPGADIYFTANDGHDTVIGNPNDTFGIEDPGTEVVQFIFPDINHSGASFTWTDVHLIKESELYDLWRGDGHITVGGAVIDIGVVYGHSDPFSQNHLEPQSAGDYLVFDDGNYSLEQIWTH